MLWTIVKPAVILSGSEESGAWGLRRRDPSLRSGWRARVSGWRSRI